MGEKIDANLDEKRSYEAKIPVLDVECRNPQARPEAHQRGNCHEKKAIARSESQVRTYTNSSFTTRMRKLMKKSHYHRAMDTINLGKYTLLIRCSLLSRLGRVTQGVGKKLHGGMPVKTFGA
jgi:hypothetical protein